MLFCPSCDALLLGADHCDQCHWAMPKPGKAGDILWQADLGVKLPKPRCTPAQIGNTLCVPTDSNHLIGLSLKDGSVLWNVEALPSDSRCLGVVAAEGLFFCAPECMEGISDTQKCVIALSPENGQTVWKYPVTALSLSMPAISNGILFVTANNRLAYAIDIQKGKLCWKEPIATPAWSPEAPLLYSAGNLATPLLVLPSRDTRVMALDASTGQPVWEYAYSEGKPARDWFFYSPLAAGEHVVAATWSNKLFALSREDGTQVWQKRIGREITSPLLVEGGRLYVGVKDYTPEDDKIPAHALYVLDATTGDLVQRIETARKPGIGHIYVTPAVHDSTIFISTDSEYTIVFDVRTGTELWRTKLPSRAVCTPVFDGESFLILTRDGTALAERYKASSPEPLLTPEQYLAQANFTVAALAYALAGDVLHAARIYEERLQDLPHALKLYEHAAAFEQAARVSEALHEPEQASVFLQRVNMTCEQAELWSRNGQHDRAAGIYESNGDLQNAAREYEAVRRFSKAAILYKSLGLNADAMRCWEQSDEKEKIAEEYRQQGDYQAAAVWYQRMGRWLDAARMYVLAKDHHNAGEAFVHAQDDAHAADEFEQGCEYRSAVEMLKAEATQHTTESEEAMERRWMRVAALCKLNTPPDLEGAARAYAVLVKIHDKRQTPDDLPPVSDHYRRFRTLEAQAWLERAKALEAGQTEQSLEAASAYDVAAHAFRDVCDDEQAGLCEDRYCYHRGLPRFVVNATGSFVEGGIEPLDAVIENCGYGPAFRIWIDLVGRAQLADIEPPRFSRIDAGQQMPRKLYVSVPEGVFGTIPMSLRLRYMDHENCEQILQSHPTAVIVKRKDERRGDTQAQIVVQGDMVQVNRNAG